MIESVRSLLGRNFALIRARPALSGQNPIVIGVMNFGRAVFEL
jgi:hypothetical protein